MKIELKNLDQLSHVRLLHVGRSYKLYIKVIFQVMLEVPVALRLAFKKMLV